ncbi:MAG: hypothetical protein GQ547_00985 [Methylophaga sp.]|nr:hypothetical protein [Methylophaga sp.]
MTLRITPPGNNDNQKKNKRKTGAWQRGIDNLNKLQELIALQNNSLSYQLEKTPKQNRFIEETRFIEKTIKASRLTSNLFGDTVLNQSQEFTKATANLYEPYPFTSAPEYEPYIQPIIGRATPRTDRQEQKKKKFKARENTKNLKIILPDEPNANKSIFYYCELTSTPHPKNTEEAMYILAKIQALPDGKELEPPQEIFPHKRLTKEPQTITPNSKNTGANDLRRPEDLKDFIEKPEKAVRDTEIDIYKLPVTEEMLLDEMKLRYPKNNYSFPCYPIWSSYDYGITSIYAKNGNGGCDSRDWDHFDVLTLNEAVSLSLGVNPLRMAEFWQDTDNYGTLHIGLYNSQYEVIYRAVLSGKIKTVSKVEEINDETLLIADDVKAHLSRCALDQEEPCPTPKPLSLNPLAIPQETIPTTSPDSNMDISTTSSFTPEELIELNKPLPNTLKSREIARLWKPKSAELYIKLMHIAISDDNLKIQAHGKKYSLVRHKEGDTSVFAKWIYEPGGENVFLNQFDVEIDKNDFKLWLEIDSLTLPEDCLLLRWWQSPALEAEPNTLEPTLNTWKEAIPAQEEAITEPEIYNKSTREVVETLTGPKLKKYIENKVNTQIAPYLKSKYEYIHCITCFREHLTKVKAPDMPERDLLILFETKRRKAITDNCLEDAGFTKGGVGGHKKQPLIERQ